MKQSISFNFDSCKILVFLDYGILSIFSVNIFIRTFSENCIFIEIYCKVWTVDFIVLQFWSRPYSEAHMVGTCDWRMLYVPDIVCCKPDTSTETSNFKVCHIVMFTHFIGVQMSTSSSKTLELPEFEYSETSIKRLHRDTWK